MVTVVHGRPWVLFRADGDEFIGSGHIMRCLALADAFADRGRDAHFVSQSCSSELRSSITARGHSFSFLAVDYEAEQLDLLADASATIRLIDAQPRKPDWVVVDHYGIEETWERNVRALGVRLAVLDDLVDRSHSCDALLNQTVLLDGVARYRSLVPANAALLLGGHYALIRSEFGKAHLRREQLAAEGMLRDVVVFLGAADNKGLTLPIAQALTECVDHSELVVLIGSLNKFGPEILEWCHQEAVRYEVDCSNVAEVFEKARVLIGACGMTAVEAQSLNIPCVLVGLSPVQRAVAEWLARERRAIRIEESDCVNSKALRESMSAIDGLQVEASRNGPFSLSGANHAADALVRLLHE